MCIAMAVCYFESLITSAYYKRLHFCIFHFVFSYLILCVEIIKAQIHFKYFSFNLCRIHSHYIYVLYSRVSFLPINLKSCKNYFFNYVDWLYFVLLDFNEYPLQKLLLFKHCSTKSNKMQTHLKQY